MTEIIYFFVFGCFCYTTYNLLEDECKSDSENPPGFEGYSHKITIYTKDEHSVKILNVDDPVVVLERSQYLDLIKCRIELEALHEVKPNLCEVVLNNIIWVLNQDIDLSHLIL